MEEFDLLFRAVVRVGDISAIQNAPRNIPGEAVLYPNYPNPFNNSTNISFDLSESSTVSFSIVNAEGKLVKHLGYFRLPAGKYNFLNWDGTNGIGTAVSTGFYFIYMRTTKQTVVRRILLIK